MIKQPIKKLRFKWLSFSTAILQLLVIVTLEQRLTRRLLKSQTTRIASILLQPHRLENNKLKLLLRSQSLKSQTSRKNFNNSSLVLRRNSKNK